MKGLILFSIMTFLMVPLAWGASKTSEVRKGNILYEKGDYTGSLNRYKEALGQDPESDIINYDAGTAYYKKGDFTSALDHLQKSLLSEDEELREKAYYNIGNTLYKFGMAQENQNLQGAIAALKNSLNHYEQALILDDKDEDTRYNHEFVKKELDRLQKQQQQQQQKQQQQQNRQDQKNQQEQQERQSQQDQQDQQQDQQDQQDQQNQPQANEQEQPAPQDQSPEGEQEQEPPPASGDVPLDQNTMSPREAEMLLNQYQQSEEPQGLLNFMKNKGLDTPVLKDW